MPGAMQGGKLKMKVVRMSFEMFDMWEWIY